MNKNQKGFGAAEGLLILVIVGLIGFVGWYVFNSKNGTDKIYNDLNNAPAGISKKSNNDQKPSTTNSKSYTFLQLGISMGVLDGWSVSSKNEQTVSGNSYSWTITKPGADGNITLTSSGFQGGFESCTLRPAKVNDVVQTKNPKLIFMSWSHSDSGHTVNNTQVALTDESIFKTKNDESADSIKNSDVKPGTYYYCLGYPGPGFNLKLNTEAAASGFERLDEIQAASIVDKGSSIATSANSYADIKAMLTSIQ